MLKDIRKFRKSVRNEKSGDNNVAIGKTDSEVLISTPKIEIEELK